MGSRVGAWALRRVLVVEPLVGVVVAGDLARFAGEGGLDGTVVELRRVVARLVLRDLEDRMVEARFGELETLGFSGEVVQAAESPKVGTVYLERVLFLKAETTLWVGEESSSPLYSPIDPVLACFRA